MLSRNNIYCIRHDAPLSTEWLVYLIDLIGCQVIFSISFHFVKGKTKIVLVGILHPLCDKAPRPTQDTNGLIML